MGLPSILKAAFHIYNPLKNSANIYRLRVIDLFLSYLENMKEKCYVTFSLNVLWSVS